MCSAMETWSVHHVAGEGGDTDSFHASMWDEERRNRQQIHFEFADDSDIDVSCVMFMFNKLQSTL